MHINEFILIKYRSIHGQIGRALLHSRVPKVYVEGVRELDNHQSATTIVKDWFEQEPTTNTKYSMEMLMSRVFT